MILPALLMAILSTTSIIQYLRSEIIDNTNQDFVKTARSKGVSEKMVLETYFAQLAFTDRAFLWLFDHRFVGWFDLFGNDFWLSWNGAAVYGLDR